MNYYIIIIELILTVNPDYSSKEEQIIDCLCFKNGQKNEASLKRD